MFQEKYVKQIIMAFLVGMFFELHGAQEMLEAWDQALESRRVLAYDGNLEHLKNYFGAEYASCDEPQDPSQEKKQKKLKEQEEKENARLARELEGTKEKKQEKSKEKHAQDNDEGSQEGFANKLYDYVMTFSASGAGQEKELSKKEKKEQALLAREFEEERKKQERVEHEQEKKQKKLEEKEEKENARLAHELGAGHAKQEHAVHEHEKKRKKLEEQEEKENARLARELGGKTEKKSQKHKEKHEKQKGQASIDDFAAQFYDHFMTLTHGSAREQKEMSKKEKKEHEALARELGEEHKKQERAAHEQEKNQKKLDEKEEKENARIARELGDKKIKKQPKHEENEQEGSISTLYDYVMTWSAGSPAQEKELTKKEKKEHEALTRELGEGRKKEEQFEREQEKKQKKRDEQEQKENARLAHELGEGRKKEEQAEREQEKKQKKIDEQEEKENARIAKAIKSKHKEKTEEAKPLNDGFVAQIYDYVMTLTAAKHNQELSEKEHKKASKEKSAKDERKEHEAELAALKREEKENKKIAKKLVDDREEHETQYLIQKLNKDREDYENEKWKEIKKTIRRDDAQFVREQRAALLAEEKEIARKDRHERKHKLYDDWDKNLSLKRESEELKLVYKEQDKKDRAKQKKVEERHTNWLKLKAKMASVSPWYDSVVTKSPELWRGNAKARKAEFARMRKEVKKEERKERQARLDAKREKFRAQYRARKHEEEERIGKWEYRYTHPSWPFPALPYKKKDLISLSGGVDLASQGYTSGGNKQDISKIIFTDKVIKIQDILVVSKLVKAGLLNPTGGGATTNHFLYFLADETISFNGSYEQYLGSFDYARRIDSTFSLGFQIPFVHRRNKLRMSANLSAAAQSKLNEGTGVTAFPATLDGYESFVIDILSRKGIGQHVKNSSTGLGNIALFGSAHIKTHLADSLVVGIKAELPTTRDRDTEKLWDAQTGSEFTKLSAYFGLLYGKYAYLNPHIYVQGSYIMAASVDRRVARRRIYNGTSGGTSTVSATFDTVTSMQGTVYADKVRYINNTAFDTPDATVTRFETDTGRVKIHPGPEFNFHVGNVFNRALSKRFEVDVYYDFRAKARDWVSSKLNPAVYDARTLTERTYEVEHKVGLGANYHIDSMFRIQGGGSYSFAGRNVAELFALYAALRIEF